MIFLGIPQAETILDSDFPCPTKNTKMNIVTWKSLKPMTKADVLLKTFQEVRVGKNLKFVFLRFYKKEF